MARGAPTERGPSLRGRPTQRRPRAPVCIGDWAELGPRCLPRCCAPRSPIDLLRGGGGGGGEKPGQVRTDWRRFPGLRALIDISTGPQAPPLRAALPPLRSPSCLCPRRAPHCPLLPEQCRASLPSLSSSFRPPSSPFLSPPLAALHFPPGSLPLFGLFPCPGPQETLFSFSSSLSHDCLFSPLCSLHFFLSDSSLLNLSLYSHNTHHPLLSFLASAP